ncbi:MAG TPA: hypothetical protein VLK29_10805 [Luteimonas sp.]|nr:hypothetical protein [Luteimonas sp.]
MTPKTTIPPTDMDPRQGDPLAGVPAGRHPGAPPEAPDDRRDEDIDAPPADA